MPFLHIATHNQPLICTKKSKKVALALRLSVVHSHRPNGRDLRIDLHLGRVASNVMTNICSPMLRTEPGTDSSPTKRAGRGSGRRAVGAVPRLSVRGCRFAAEGGTERGTGAIQMARATSSIVEADVTSGRVRASRLTSRTGISRYHRLAASTSVPTADMGGEGQRLRTGGFLGLRPRVWVGVQSWLVRASCSASKGGVRIGKGRLSA